MSQKILWRAVKAVLAAMGLLALSAVCLAVIAGALLAIGALVAAPIGAFAATIILIMRAVGVQI